jgi:hypothetical protein
MSANDAGDSARRADSRWISPVGWVIIVLVVGFVLIYVLIGHLRTARLTVHNRTTEPVSFTTDSFGSYPNYVGACSSNEFRWKEDGGEFGWTPADDGGWQGGAVEIALPVERWFEFQPAERLAVLVTGAGVVEVEPESSTPSCEGTPPASPNDDLSSSPPIQP